MSNYRAVINTLTEKEKDVLGQVALNCDEGHPTKILKRLEDLGLISRMTYVDIAGYWYTPLPVHIAWCEYCSLRTILRPKMKNIAAMHEFITGGVV